MRLDDGVVQIIVEDGELRVIGLNYGGGDFTFADDDRLNDPFLLQTLVAATTHLLRRTGYETDAEQLHGYVVAPQPAPPAPFPTPPYGI